MTDRNQNTARSASENPYSGPVPASVPESEAGAMLYRRVRAGLVLRGRTLEGIAQSLGVDRRNLSRAIKGGWRGPKATALRSAACRAAGLHPETDQ